MKDDRAVDPEKSGPQRKRKLTMTDVAEVAGVSQATVSLVLNNVGGSRVNGDTVKKVRAAARKIGYSLARRNPVGAGAIQSIGYIIEDTLTNPMVNIAIEAARQAAWENDCVLLVLPTQGDSELGIAALDILIEQRLAGIIMSSFFTRKISIPPKLRSQRSVLLNCYSDRNSVPTLLPAHYEGAREGVEHLIERGHKRIAMINGPLWLDAYSDRLDGYKTALETAGLPFDPSLVFYGDVRISDGQRGTTALLDKPDAPTAIFCCADQVALGCYEELKSRGLRIPDDMAVLGFDNDPMVQLLEPPLTTIAVPHAGMGKSAVAHLLAMRDGTSEDIINGRVLCDAPLIVRQST